MSLHTPARRCYWCKHFKKDEPTKGHCFRTVPTVKTIKHINSKCDFYELAWADMRGEWKPL